MTWNDLPALAVLKDGPILLYDGECGVCSRSVQWILDHERTQSLRFAPLKSQLGQRLTSAAKVPDSIDSMLWVEGSKDGATARYWSSAVFSTLGYVGGPWRLFMLLAIVPRPVRDRLYRVFAKYRLKIAPKACLIPNPETRSRFLDS